MQLWKWCDLLSRNQRREAGRLLADHLRRSNDGKLIFFGPGETPDVNDEKIDTEQANQILSLHPASTEFLNRLLPAELADPPERIIAEDLKPDIIAEWINDDELSRLLFENLSEKDYWPGALQRLQEIRLENPEQFAKYRGLAVALALVYDQAWPLFWPHRQVDPKHVPIAKMSAAQWFSFWVESNESSTLMFDLRTLSPSEIKFIVDAPVELSEFRWARKHAKYQRSEFAKAFDAVTYSVDRANSGRFNWTQGEYTLQNLRLQDGICVDQAYYAVIVGKARGLPTLFFTGQGSQGGHAWFGYMKMPGHWELDCGRYKNQNYAIGIALDPQTWLPISDHELKFRQRGLSDARAYFAAEDDILIGRMSEAAGDGPKALKAYESAIQVCPQNPAGWTAKADYLLQTGASLSARRSHHEAAIRQFLTHRDARVVNQVALAKIARQAGAVQEAESLERQIIAQNKRRRSDLSVNVAAEKILTLLEGRRFDLALTEYRRQLRNFAGAGGGNFFYDIVQPLAEALLADGREHEAREVLTLARRALQPETGGTLENDLRELERSVESGSRPLINSFPLGPSEPFPSRSRAFPRAVRFPSSAACEVPLRRRDPPTPSSFRPRGRAFARRSSR